MKYLAYAVLAVSASAEAARPAPPMLIEQRTVIRIRTFAPPEPARPISWREHKGPKCIRMDMLGGAAVNDQDSIDLVLRGGQRLRARLEKGCPAHDYFYSGFYLTPSADGQVCVGRDMFHSRIGGDCAITKFRALEMQR